MITNILDFNAFHVFLAENIEDNSVSAIINTPDNISVAQIESILSKGFDILVKKEPELSARMFVALAKALGDSRDDLVVEIIDIPS
ncbi:MAG: hypothetical protein WBA74_06900 [Cyclobacteriaceae bacterium]